MRQVGVLAAAGLIALEESTPKLIQDHKNAKRLAEGVASLNDVKIDLETVQTNIVIFDVTEAKFSSNEICEKLKENAILAIPFGNQIRMVTHYDVSKDEIEKTLRIFSTILS